MDRKPAPFIPIESLKTQRVEVYINDLQEQLHQLRTKYGSIFIECCDIQRKIHEVSTETMTKQQEIGKIISEFEEFRPSTANRSHVLEESLVQNAGEVKRLRERFETVFQENLEHLIVRANSIKNMDQLKMGSNGTTSSQPQTPWKTPAAASVEQNSDSELWSTFESFYSFSSAPSQDIPEPLCIEGDEVSEAID